jgi:hypothetical protein
MFQILVQLALSCRQEEDVLGSRVDAPQKPNCRSPMQGLERQGLRRHLPSRCSVRAESRDGNTLTCGWVVTLKWFLSAFRDGGSLRPTSECRVPQPRWVERVGEREGGKERGGRRPARERWESRGLRVRPAPRSGALAVGDYKHPRG